MDDDDFDSELLGGLQRQHNLRQNEATRQEIAALRADLKRKEAAEKAAPKCPYCAGVITDGVVKCRHCSSDIKWHEVDSKSYPMMAEEDSQHFVATKLPKLLEEERRRTIESPLGKIESKVRSLMEEGQKISAIKYLREECDELGLADAKMQVERLESGQPFLLKEGKLATGSSSGCLIAACTIPAGLLTFKALDYFLA